MKHNRLIILVISISLIIGSSAAAEKLYVSDSFTITLRTGPSTENKIIRILNSGQPLEVLETRDKWSHVKATLKNDIEVEGWVRNQYLMDRVPYEVQAGSFAAENRKLKEKLSTISNELKSFQKDKQDISGQFDKTQSELISLKKEYEDLKKSSAQYLALKKKYDESIIKMNSTEERINRLETENASIKKSKNYIWFGTGALVLLFGFLIGAIAGRQGKMRGSYF